MNFHFKFPGFDADREPSPRASQGPPRGAPGAGRPGGGAGVTCGPPRLSAARPSARPSPSPDPYEPSGPPSATVQLSQAWSPRRRRPPSAARPALTLPGRTRLTRGERGSLGQPLALTPRLGAATGRGLK